MMEKLEKTYSRIYQIKSDLQSKDAKDLAKKDYIELLNAIDPKYCFDLATLSGGEIWIKDDNEKEIIREKQKLRYEQTQLTDTVEMCDVLSIEYKRCIKEKRKEEKNFWIKCASALLWWLVAYPVYGMVMYNKAFKFYS